MRLTHSLLIAAMLLPACKNKDDEPPPMPAPPPPVVVEQPTELAPAQPAGLTPVVRAELHERQDGITGTPVAVPGARATLQVPRDWKVEKTPVQIATAPDQKSRLALAAHGTEAPTTTVDKLASASGLSDCQWGTAESVTVGKDKLSAQATDGSCKRGGADVPAASMVAEGLVTVASWDQDADRSGVFGSMRSVAKAKTGVGAPSNLIACCRALAQNAKSAPPPQSGFMMQAAASCEAAAAANNLEAVNAALRQFGMKCN